MGLLGNERERGRLSKKTWWVPCANNCFNYFPKHSAYVARDQIFFSQDLSVLIRGIVFLVKGNK